MADTRDQADPASTSDQDAGEKRILAQFKSEDGEFVATPFDLPIDVTQGGLQLLCNAALQNVSFEWWVVDALGAIEMCYSAFVYLDFGSFHMSLGIAVL